MAALTSAGVTINSIYYTGARVGSKRKVVDVTLVLSSQGGLTNSIAASLFGMTTITRASGFRDSSSVQAQAAPSWDGTLLVFCTAETAGTPADKSATYRGIVEGIE